jgi:hypothetical protein
MWREILTQLFIGAFVGGGAYAVKEWLVQILRPNDWPPPPHTRLLMRARPRPQARGR